MSIPSAPKRSQQGSQQQPGSKRSQQGSQRPGGPSQQVRGSAAQRGYGSGTSGNAMTQEAELQKAFAYRQARVDHQERLSAAMAGVPDPSEDHFQDPKRTPPIGPITKAQARKRAKKEASRASAAMQCAIRQSNAQRESMRASMVNTQYVEEKRNGGDMPQKNKKGKKQKA